MRIKNTAYFQFSLYSIYAIVILLQFQLDFRVFETTLRIGASDLLIPLLLLLIVYLTPKEIIHQEWEIKWLPIWFITFTLWLGVSLLIGYIESGVLSTWALGNKFIGWLVLMGYFLIGGYTKNLNNKISLQMFRILFITNWAIGIYSILVWPLRHYLIYLPFGINIDYRLIGFLENPNAFGFFNVFLLLLHISIISKKSLFPRWVNVCGLAMNSIFIIGSTSRGAMLATIFGLAILIVRKAISLRSVVLINIAAVVSFLCYSIKTKLYIYTFNPIIWTLSDLGVEQRINSMRLALRWWLEHPVIGIGLGSFVNRELQENILPVITIHQTPIWLLTETGLIGLILILVFSFYASKNIYKSSLPPKDNALAVGGLSIIAAFALASFTTEIMYQRYLWFLLGMLLVQQPLREKFTEIFPHSTVTKS